MRNRKGDLINGIPELEDKSYGTGYIDENGVEQVNWNLVQEAEGFDSRYEIKEVELKKDERIIRYGSPLGRFFAPQNTEYEQLSLPYLEDSIEFSVYSIIADGVIVKCIMKKGIVAPAFNRKGGGIQYLSEYTVKELLRTRRIERILL